MTGLNLTATTAAHMQRSSYGSMATQKSEHFSIQKLGINHYPSRFGKVADLLGISTCKLFTPETGKVFFQLFSPLIVILISVTIRKVYDNGFHITRFTTFWKYFCGF